MTENQRSSLESDLHRSPLWWHKGVIYQIYPRSFYDANGDGVGDLKGITDKLDYIKWLGADAIWISPFYPSPMADFGYDVADYCNVDPLFGSLEEFVSLSKKCKELDLKVILDFVPNHTSDEHPWFIESRSSRDNPKRNWYIWADPKPDGSPPNNWLSTFGGSGWELDEKTGQYYYHAFLSKQPDLNWRNPEVVEAMLSVLRFWLDLGVDGFRVDVIWHIIKDYYLRDNPPSHIASKPDTRPYDRQEQIYTTDRPEVHDLIIQMRKTIESYGHDKLLIGEVYLPTERLMAYYGPHANGAHMPYNFQLTLLPWKVDEIMRAVDRYESLLPIGAWPNWVLGNHDKPRIASRVAPHQVRGAQLLLLTLRGTPTMYYGDELGMQDILILPDEVKDSFEIQEPGRGNGRDPERTPMPWDNSKHAGFSTAEMTWLPVGANAQKNVQSQKEDKHSLLNMVRELLHLRKEITALSIGDYHPLPSQDPVVAFRRTYAEENYYVLINFSNDTTTYPLSHSNFTVIFSTDAFSESIVSKHISLQGGQGVVIKSETDHCNIK